MSASYAAPGHIQVKAAIGVSISINAQQKVIEETEGVTFLDLTPGAHRLIARRSGFVMQHASVWVRPGEVTVHRLSPWQRRIGAGGNATIVVQTIPVDATVSAQTLGYEKTTKGDDALIISRVPTGEHKLTFCTEYKCIDYRAKIVTGDLVKLLVLFDRGEVQDHSRAYREKLVQGEVSCLKTRNPDACHETCVTLTRLGETSKTCNMTKKKARTPIPTDAARSWLKPEAAPLP